MNVGAMEYGSWRTISKALALIVMIFTGGAALAEERPETAPVIVAFGDSLTQGYGLPEADGFVPQLRAWLAREGWQADVINAGVSGDTTAGGAARIDWTLTDEVDGIIVALGGNDLLRGLDPAQARANLDKIVKAAIDRDINVLLVGMQAPGNFGASYKEQFDAIYPDLAERYGTSLASSFFLGLSQEGIEPTPAEVQQWMQPDGIHPNAKGVALIVDALGPYVTELLIPEG